MKRKYGLTFSEEKRISIRKSCMGRIKQVKYTVYEAVKTVQTGCTSLRKLSWRLKERGVTTRFIHRGSNPAEEVQGSIFTMNGQTFKASKVDWKFSYANLCSTIEKNQFVANTAKKVMERTEIDGRRISEYLRQVEQIEQEKRKSSGKLCQFHRKRNDRNAPRLYPLRNRLPKGKRSMAI